MPGRKTAQKEPFDLSIIGLGPAGVACLLQAARDGLRVAAVSDEPIGGLVRAARRLDNLPALAGISGPTLASRFRRQLAAISATLVRDTATAISSQGRIFEISLWGGGKLLSRTVVLATGTSPLAWEHDQPGVHRDARTLPQRLPGKSVLIAGGGEAALDTALNCRDRGAAVMVLVRGEAPRAPAKLLREARAAGVAVRTSTRIEALSPAGKGFQARVGGRLIHADFVLACIGRRPRDELLRILKTSYDEKAPAGVFMAGDLIRGADRYVATAMGDGQRAALAALAYLRRLRV